MSSGRIRAITGSLAPSAVLLAIAILGYPPDEPHGELIETGARDR